MSEVTYNRVNWKDTPSTETPINATNLNKMDKGIADVTAAVNECFQSASEGKTLIAAALTGKGQASTVADTFAQMAAKIGNLMAVPTETKNITANANNIDVKDYAKVNVAVNPHYTSHTPTEVLDFQEWMSTTGGNHTAIWVRSTPSISISGNNLVLTVPVNLRQYARTGGYIKDNNIDFVVNLSNS